MKIEKGKKKEREERHSTTVPQTYQPGTNALSVLHARHSSSHCWPRYLQGCLSCRILPEVEKSPRGWWNMDPEPRVVKAEKKIVTTLILSFLMAEVVTDVLEGTSDGSARVKYVF
jgi:hypothetical protein